MGSSPLTRGKLGDITQVDWSEGLIPAHAGKTLARPRRLCACRAHPRSRGENLPKDATVREMRGSSPLTRGKPVGKYPRSRASGLIPAHAGKTGTSPGAETPGRAHPRSRGENAGIRHPARPFSGSSPLTRGKRRRRVRRRRMRRLIPAHAGKTYCLDRCHVAPPAHPRSRGENLARCSHSSRPLGSSPLTRGKPAVSASVIFLVGLIPAHAGKTVALT